MIINVDRRTVEQLIKLCASRSFRLSLETVNLAVVNYDDQPGKLIIVKIEGDILLDSGVKLEELSEKDLIALLLE